VKLLLQRVRDDQLAQFRHYLGVPPQVQIGVDPLHQDLQSLVRDGGNRAVPQQLRGHVGERLAAPQPQCLPQQASGLRPVSGLGRGVSAAGERGELTEVKLAVRDVDQVTGRSRLDQAGAGGVQCRAQPLYGGMQRAARARRGPAFPYCLGESLHADHSPGAEQQRREQHPLPRRRHGHISRAIAD
jgi:hypothetical protein